MAIKPKLNVSGYRGIWGETLTEEIVKNYVRAFAFFTKEELKKQNINILIGRDGRGSGPQIKKVILQELENLGVNAIDGDIMPTPTVLFSVRKHKYDGAIIITASHNPIEYNGLKFINKKALFLENTEIKKVNEYYTKEISGKEKNVTSVSTHNFLLKICYAWLASLRNASRSNTLSFSKEHIDKILANVNVTAIRDRKFKVAVDMINASACVMYPYIFEQLGVELIPLNNIPNGLFAHKPEPLKENLSDLSELVKNSKADLGFAHDPDADRLVVVNENGEVISEEYSLALGIENVLSKNPNQKIVINLSTSQMNVDIAKKYNSECFRSKIGEGNVVQKMISLNAIIGGEGGGGVIYPKINTARDSFTGLALILELLAERKQTVSECISTLPKYFIKKDKWTIEGKNLNEIYLKLKSHFKNAEIDEQDGLRLDFKDSSWIHLRPSNTEPIIRLIGEAKSENAINKLFEQTKSIL